jgi:radical SAM protein with 4Fe4S-binding SPASM domain
VHFAGHAMIDSPTTGCGLMPALAVVPMAPPRRVPCRQLTRRMTVLSDGQVALCDQDWLSRSPAGSVRDQSLADLWRAQQQPRDAHRDEQWDDVELCAGCDAWHRV